ncbi:hypothetical protein [Nitrosopumilus sp.]|uniref:hypothetical protein n=1 Tax=Nitrosopumilus sp. TaxID=2024843 RepID=UPI00247C1FED|nr:hypothetical protein [Nitrosopumilus sp.]MCV0430338.1 hypothetical protein [Nitrosopumilus sp.]
MGKHKQNKKSKKIKSEPKSENKIHLNKSKIEKKIKIGIIISIILLSIGAVYAYSGGFNTIHPYLGDRVLLGGFAVQQHPDNPPELDMQVVLKTDSLSAQNPIIVEARQFPNENILKYKPDPWNYLPEKQYVIFPYALKFPLEQHPEGFNKPAIIELTKSKTNREYYGTGKIFYERGGNYGFFFTGSDSINAHSDGFTSSFSIEEVNARVKDMTRFDVGTIEETNSLKTYNIALAGFFITLAGLGIKYKQKINESVSWFDSELSKNKRLSWKKVGVLFGITVTVIIVSILTFNGTIGPEKYVHDGVYGDDYVSLTHQYKITKSGKEWFFIRDFWHNRERFDFSIPNYKVIGGVLIPHSIDEKISVLVFQGDEGNSENLSELISRDLQYLSDGGRKGEFTYTWDEKNNKVTISGGWEEPFIEIKGKIVQKDNLIYFVYGEMFNQNMSAKTKNELNQIVESFHLI